MNKKQDTLNFIMEVESGDFDHNREDHLNCLQNMVNTGEVFQLQGSWSRFAQSMIQAGIVHPALDSTLKPKVARQK